MTTSSSKLLHLLFDKLFGHRTIKNKYRVRSRKYKDDKWYNELLGSSSKSIWVKWWWTYIHHTSTAMILMRQLHKYTKTKTQRQIQKVIYTAPQWYWWDNCLGMAATTLMMLLQQTTTTTSYRTYAKKYLFVPCNFRFIANICSFSTLNVRWCFSER